MASENIVFETPRLQIRRAGPSAEDVELFYLLWTDPRVMVNVGFPSGLRTTREEIRASLEQEHDEDFNRHLIIVRKEEGSLLGEAWMSRPDPQGISETDIKLRPAFWRQGYGVEVKRGLVSYLFTHSNCQAIRATPNIENITSIKMQEAVGGVRVGEEVSEFPPAMQAYTRPVHHFIYLVYREDWEKGELKKIPLDSSSGD